MSVWAFEKLTDKKWGVIGIKYRRVPCEHKPEKQAPAISNPSPLPSQPDWGKQHQHRAEVAQSLSGGCKVMSSLQKVCAGCQHDQCSKQHRLLLTS